jgi:hypothetical protein
METKKEGAIIDLESQLKGSRATIRQLTHDRDEERKNRVAFQKKIMEFQEYKMNAESDIVSSSSSQGRY